MIEAKGIAKNIPMKPNKEPNKNTEYRIAKGCNPNLSPIIFGDKKQASKKKAVKNIASI